jgi:heterodisulfide reductase subunit C
MSGRKYDVIPQNGDCSRESNMKSVIKMQRRYRTRYGNDPPSDKAIRRWLKQFQETGSVVHRKGAGRPTTSQEDVDRIQEAFSRSPHKSTGRVSLQLDVPQTTVCRVIQSTDNKTF